MNPNQWLEKAERLRSELARLRCAPARSDGQPDTHEPETIARFLREEFSDEPPEDTATLPLFVTPHR